MVRILASGIMAFWVCAIALVSVQNAAPVSLRFLGLQSVQMPFGLVLAFSAAVGMVGMAIVLPKAGANSRKREDFEL
ncbi:MAG: DUF1049 domain-containing protein [Cyanobacteria bacterium CRU_2_1]|nr:DUF1049 domain-containing protein [Cyanobacteria bacterium CRU_2_1]